MSARSALVISLLPLFFVQDGKDGLVELGNLMKKLGYDNAEIRNQSEERMFEIIKEEAAKGNVKSLRKEIITHLKETKDEEVKFRLDRLVKRCEGGEWKKIANVEMIGTIGYTTSVLDDKLIIWGGLYVNYEFVYYARKDEWRKMTKSPLKERQYPKALTTDNKIIIWGGRGKHEEGMSVEEHRNGFNDGAIHDFSKCEWRKIVDCPIKGMIYPFSSVSGDKLIIWGGNTIKGPRNDGAIYDIKNDKWKKMADCPIEARLNCLAIISESRFIIWGGGSVNTKYYSDGAVYSVEDNKWNKMSECPLKGRVKPTAAMIGDKLFIWGSDEGSLNDGAVYDLKKDVWKKVSESPVQGKCKKILLLKNGKMLIWGRFLPEKTITLYDINKDEWEKISNAPANISEDSVFLIEDKFLVFGINKGNEFEGAIYNCTLEKWSEMASCPLNADKYHIAVAIKDKLLICGVKSAENPYIKTGAVFSLPIW